MLIIRMKNVVGVKEGRVIYLNFWKAFAPSTSDAS